MSRGTRFGLEICIIVFDEKREMTNRNKLLTAHFVLLIIRVGMTCEEGGNGNGEYRDDRTRTGSDDD